MGDIDSLLAAFDSSDEEEQGEIETQHSQASTTTKTSTPTLVPLDFDGAAQSGSTSPLIQRKRLVSDSEDEENELLENKKELSESGRNVKKLLKKQEDRQKDTQLQKSLHQLAATYAAPTVKREAKLGIPQAEEPKKPTPTDFDPFFRFKIRNPKVSSEMFESLCDGMTKQRLSALTQSNAPSDGFISMGVLVDKSEIKKSANGNQFIIWKLHDLRDCQQQPVKCLLFGEAFKSHQQLLPGNSVAIVNPQLGDNNDGKDKSVVLKFVRPAQIVEVGWSADFGKCRGIKADQVPCQNFVNVSLSDFCVYHVMSQVKKLSAKRGTFNALSSAPPIPKKPPVFLTSGPGIVRSTAGIAITTPKINSTTAISGTPVTKEDEQKNLLTIVSTRAHLFGAKNLVRLQQAKTPGEKAQLSAVPGSITAFLKENKDALEEKRRDDLRKARMYALRCEESPRLSFNADEKENVVGPHLGKNKNEMAKQRAAEILRLEREQIQRDGGQKKGIKRAAEPPSSSAKRVPLDKDEVPECSTKSLLERKSKFTSAANKAESEAVGRYLTTLEAQEKIETFATTTMSIKEVACGYTAQSQSDLCRQAEHVVTKHKAEKRFFKCKNCKRRVIAFGRLPTRPCETCGTSEWVPVAMKDERKTALDREKLQIRGEERTFVNI
ncbi:unnamed protein product, partial [Mesorhabditis belari]|uniref:Protein MCM10 homolog n=1 Tax=Mesorhabditis belari TaxID=2138241 RepID=A0AAF3J8D7_9BILA